MRRILDSQLRQIRIRLDELEPRSTFANMAALDNLDARSDPGMEKVTGGRTKEQKGASDRNTYRKVLGVETIRELKVK